MKKILLIGTGGTIASVQGSEGLSPERDGSFLMKGIVDASGYCISTIQVMNVDSSNMNPRLIAKIAETVADEYDSYDGFVVTHGTDTLGYTSAALTYMLQNLGKALILTGSQLSPDSDETDAFMNLSDSLTFACEDIAGVFVCFNGLLINGTRAVKMKTRGLDAFASINFPQLAVITNGTITYNNDMLSNKLLKAGGGGLQLKSNLCEDVFLLKLYPGLKSDIFDYIRASCRGVVIESFGIGGIPNSEPDLLAKIKELIEAKITVVVTTQCLEEGIDLGVYEVGRKLRKTGVIIAGNMNTEALIMKLMWALSNIENPENVKVFIEKEVSGDTSSIMYS